MTGGRRQLVAVATAHYAKSPSWDRPALMTGRDQIITTFTALGYTLVPALGIDPTKQQLLAGLRQVCLDADPEDTLVVYIGGHGERLETGHHVLLTNDTAPEDVGGALDTARLATAMLRQTPVRKLLLLLDTCYSGLGANQALAEAVATINANWSQSARNGFVLVSSAYPKQQAQSGVFPTLLTQAIRTVARAEPAPASLPLPSVVQAIEDNKDRPRTQTIGWSNLGATGELPDFLPHPSHTGPNGIKLVAPLDDVTAAAVTAARAAMRPEVLPDVDRLSELTKKLGAPEQIQTPLIITGEGGYGKSVLLGQLFDRFTLAGPTVLLPCSRVPSTADLSNYTALDQAFGNAVGDSRTSPSLTSILARFDERPRLLVDTLDLIVREENADDLAYLLRRLAERASVVITCRDREWRDYLEADRGLAAATYHMPALTFEDIVSWSFRYTSAIELAAADTATFLKSLEEPALREVLATPLRLAMACKIYAAEGGIPDDLTVTKLYEEYWSRRIALDRKGMRTTRAQAQQAAADALAAEIWDLSRTRFVEYVPAERYDRQAVGDLVSDGVVVEATGRYGFFHQTFAEFAVARRLARAGQDSDLVRLSAGLRAHSLAYWPVAKHLLMLETSSDRYGELSRHVPLDIVEGMRTRVLGAFNRTDPAILDDDLTKVDPALFIAGVRVLESCPDECLDVAVQAVLRQLPTADKADLPRLATTATELADRAGPKALQQVMGSIFARAGTLGHDVTSSVLSRMVSQIRPDRESLGELVAAFDALPEAARALLIGRIAGGSLDTEFLRALILQAIRFPIPSGASDNMTILLHRGWSDPELRAELGWASWQSMVESDLPKRWDTCQIRLLARLCVAGIVPTAEVLATAFGADDVARERYTNVVCFLADDDLTMVLERIRSLGSLHRGAVGTLCSVLSHVGDRLPDAVRPGLVRLLKEHLHLSARRVWPVIVKLSRTDVGSLRAAAVAVTFEDDEVRRSTFDTFLNVLEPSAVALLADELRALATGPSPKEQERRAKLEGILTPTSVAAREWVERQAMHGTGRNLVSVAAREAVNALGDWVPDDLQRTGLPWLMRLLQSRWPHAVLLIAKGLRENGFVPRKDQVKAVLDRLSASLKALDDAQVAESLLELLISTEHATGLQGKIVRDLLAVYREATAHGLQASAPAVAVDRLPAIYNQYSRVITAVAVRHLAVDELHTEIARLCTTLDIARIANRARRVLASTLISLIHRNPTLLPEIEQLWPNSPDANKFGIAEAFTTYEAGSTGVRSLVLARRPDCPANIASYIHNRFPQ